MFDWKRIKVLPERLVTGLLLMTWGAWLILNYVEYAQPEIAKHLAHTSDQVLLVLCIVNFANLVVRPQNNVDVPQWSDASVAMSGAGVILLTGFAGALWIGKYADGGGYIDAAIIVFFTLLAAWAVWRWAKANAANIGEARFDTTHNHT